MPIKQISRLWSWRCEKVFQIYISMCIWECVVVYTKHTWSTSPLIPVTPGLHPRETDNLPAPSFFCPDLFPPLLSPQGNVCFPAAGAWTVSLLAESLLCSDVREYAILYEYTNAFLCVYSWRLSLHTRSLYLCTDGRWNWEQEVFKVRQWEPHWQQQSTAGGHKKKYQHWRKEI